MGSLHTDGGVEVCAIRLSIQGPRIRCNPAFCTVSQMILIVNGVYCTTVIQLSSKKKGKKIVFLALLHVGVLH